jgi:4-amino-4-deoxy-L-arabinose transferase-like glycosyltransferase
MPPVYRALGVALIVALCVMAQGEFYADSAFGYLWLGAAGIAAFLLVPPQPRGAVNAPAPSLEAAGGMRRAAGIVILVVGIFLLVGSARLFHDQFMVSSNVTDGVWFQYLGGLALALVGGLLIVGIGRLPRPDVTMLVVVGIFALALFLRVYQLDQYPFGVWIDEAIYGMDVRQMLADPFYRPFFVDNLAFPHLFFYTVSLQAFGLSNIVGLRFISALLASLGVFAAYLVGRELRGAWFGVLLALLLAVIRWSVNFSRIGMTGAELSTFILLAFYVALRFARYGRLRDGMWFGIVVAFGIYFYRAYQVQLLAVALYLLLAYPFLRRPAKYTLALIGAGLLAGLLVLIPLGLFALDRGEEYFGRVNQVSIFNEDLPGETTVNEAILESTVKHLQMFHLHGDNNGRHNLPRAPMLDPVMGSLFVVGLFVALRERRREHLVFLVSIGVALAGGIFSVSFEAPQGLRAIGAIVGVIYFAALGLSGLARLIAFTLEQAPRMAARGAAVGAALVALLVLAAWNTDVYFNQQRVNLDVWRSYFTTETLTAQFYASYPEGTRFYVSPLIGDPPPVRFLAQDALARSRSLVMPDPLPLRVPPDAPVVVMLLPWESYYVAYLDQLYPNAVIRPVRPVDYGVDAHPDETLFTVIELSAADIASVQGLEDGQGILYAPLYSDYRFSFEGQVSLQIDGADVRSGDAIRLAEGNHTIAVTPADAEIQWLYSNVTEPEPIPQHFLFHDPVAPNGVLASYYDNADFAGAPVREQLTSFIYQYIHVLPMDRPYSVRYEGYLYAPDTGDYQFGLNIVDTGDLSIDGEVVIEIEQPGQYAETVVRLDQGWHAFEARRRDISNGTLIYLSWMPPAMTEWQVIQPRYLCPTETRCAAPAETASTDE